MNAKELWEIHGDNLIGKAVVTIPVGDWPGGLAKVVSIGGTHDREEDNIFFYVDHLDEKIRTAHPDMGIFGDEEISLLPENHCSVFKDRGILPSKFRKPKTIRKQVGTISVDSGLCWIGDPSYIHKSSHEPASSEWGADWREFCDTLKSKRSDKNPQAVQFNFSTVIRALGFAHQQDMVMALFRCSQKS